jgi:hypothetical protein
MWHQLAIAVCLMLVLEGIVPFLYPARWRALVTVLAGIEDRTLRITGLASMLTGLVLLWLIN